MNISTFVQGKRNAYSGYNSIKLQNRNINIRNGESSVNMLLHVTLYKFQYLPMGIVIPSFEARDMPVHVTRQQMTKMWEVNFRYIMVPKLLQIIDIIRNYL